MTMTLEDIIGLVKGYGKTDQDRTLLESSIHLAYEIGRNQMVEEIAKLRSQAYSTSPAIKGE